MKFFNSVGLRHMIAGGQSGSLGLALYQERCLLSYFVLNKKKLVVLTLNPPLMDSTHGFNKINIIDVFFHSFIKKMF